MRAVIEELGNKLGVKLVSGDGPGPSPSTDPQAYYIGLKDGGQSLSQPQSRPGKVLYISSSKDDIVLLAEYPRLLEAFYKTGMLREMRFWVGGRLGWTPLFYGDLQDLAAQIERARANEPGSGANVTKLLTGSRTSDRSDQEPELHERIEKLVREMVVPAAGRADEWARKLISEGWLERAVILDISKLKEAGEAARMKFAPPTAAATIESKIIRAEEKGVEPELLSPAQTQSPSPPLTTQPPQPYYNKISLEGMVADIEGFALKPIGSTRGSQANLWYLSMVGNRQAVEAIWAGLVNSPPKWCDLYCEETVEPAYLRMSEAEKLAYRRAKPANMKVQLAPRTHSEGWITSKCQLGEANATQTALFPVVSFDELPAGLRRKHASGPLPSPSPSAVSSAPGAVTPAGTGSGSGAAAGTGSEVKATTEAVTASVRRTFEIILPPMPVAANTQLLTNLNLTLERIQHLYWRRLNALSKLPLHPSWAEWLWRTAMDNAEIELLEAHNVQVWLCQQPDDEKLSVELSQAIRLGQLSFVGDR